MTTRLKTERGAALLEAAVTIPLLLLVAIGIFEFGRAYQAWQVLTNAAREGTRLAVVPDPTPGIVEQRVLEYMQAGLLPNADEAVIDVNRSASMTVNGASVPASVVTIDYPFTFMFLQPIANLVNPDSAMSGAVTMRAQALMRNE